MSEVLSIVLSIALPEKANTLTRLSPRKWASLSALGMTVLLHGFTPISAFAAASTLTSRTIDRTADRTTDRPTDRIIEPSENTSAGSDEEMNYDSIVESLQQQHLREVEASHRLAAKRSSLSSDPFANVWMHGGFGWATSFQSIHDPQGRALQLNHKGIQATLGIDLFSLNWMAEGSARALGEASDRDDNVSLKEFDLKILYKNNLNRAMKYKFGGGLSGRYMSVRMSDGTSRDYTTPSSVATFGLDLYLARQLSIGIDASVRNSLVAETVDRSSIDSVLRMDAHF